MQPMIIKGEIEEIGEDIYLGKKIYGEVQRLCVNPDDAPN